MPSQRKNSKVIIDDLFEELHSAGEEMRKLSNELSKDDPPKDTEKVTLDQLVARFLKPFRRTRK